MNYALNLTRRSAALRKMDITVDGVTFSLDNLSAAYISERTDFVSYRQGKYKLFDLDLNFTYA